MLSKNQFCFLASIGFLLPQLTFALFCPNNFRQINEGDTIAQVIAECGKPDKQETKKVKPEGPQEWSYFIPQTVTNNSLTPMQGTLKTQITFDKEGKAINISVNGIGVGATQLCGATIQLGDTRETVKSACGQPSFINTQSNPAGSLGGVEEVVITTFIYNSQPPVTLTFENGKLKQSQ